MKLTQKLIIFSFASVLALKLNSQNRINPNLVLEAMLEATKYMVEEVSYNGGYVWYYLPDFSRQWGEMEAYKTMVWLQHPGTISMGHLFLDAYRVTKDEYYYSAAEKAASALIWGQSHEGGWNYMIDFAGDRSLKQWYNTIGKNGWRLEEFQHYYGNSTFDDDVTSDAARFLMRMYLEKMDPKYKPAIDKAIGFVLKSQYPNGGWPQRYPYVKGFETDKFPDYTPFYTFNDDVIWENIHFLMQCYLVLGEERFLEPIYRGMNFYKISQDEIGAWGQQLDMNMKTASARTYEPAAFLPRTTCENALLLIKFYKLTGDKMFLGGVPKAISWLEQIKLSENKVEGHRTHPTFLDAKTNKPIYVHRRGSNVVNGEYYMDENDSNLLSHYYGKAFVQLDYLKDEYQKVLKLSEAEIAQNSPLKPKQFQDSQTPQRYYDLNRYVYGFEVDEKQVSEVLSELDDANRWLTTRAYISNPYIGDPEYTIPTDEFATTRVGDEYDTSPYPNKTNQLFISTGTYIRNMKILIGYLKNVK
ncbi:pectate lyase [Aestuariibaculum marinum]|uniref:Pectate lyase n=1 Tax=Aestuariibaculum marinum TaxID=2683592 RepID=A0A8J6Q3Q6_9FLAO|nr:pectate lyase [Aestuariibaculum marinum]MBD0823749.1 pectate lyase [Aestuariibaculum marinum]